MKKTLLFILSLVIVFSAAYYFSSINQSTKDEKEETYAYLVVINHLNKQQQEISRKYQEEVINAEDAEAGYDYLENELLKAYEDYMKEVSMVKLDSEKLQAIHTLYVDAVNTDHEIYKSFVLAYNSQEEDLYEETKKKMAASQKLFKEHEDKAKTYGVELGLEFKESN